MAGSLNLGHVVGPAGQGVASGGTTGQYLKKASSTDYDTAWESFANATQSAAGMMSTADKTKLDGLPASAAVPGSIAIIVDGDTAGMAVAPGAYAYIKNNTHGLAEGLYRNKSSSAFPVSGGTANSTVFEAVSGGLGSEVTSLNSKIAQYQFLGFKATNLGPSAVPADYGATGFYICTSVWKSAGWPLDYGTVFTFIQDLNTTYRGFQLVIGSTGTTTEAYIRVFKNGDWQSFKQITND